MLIVGSGGREHALAWKLAQSEECAALYCAPGSPGTAAEPGVTNVALDVADNAAVRVFSCVLCILCLASSALVLCSVL